MLFGPPGSFQSPLLSSLVLRLRRDRIILRGKTEFAVLLPSNLSVECVYCTLCNHIFTPSVPYVCGSERKCGSVEVYLVCSCCKMKLFHPQFFAWQQKIGDYEKKLHEETTPSSLCLLTKESKETTILIMNFQMLS